MQSCTKSIERETAQQKKRFGRSAVGHLANWLCCLVGSKPQKSEAVTDLYLADLAAKHGLKLATFDTGIQHRAVDLVS